MMAPWSRWFGNAPAPAAPGAGSSSRPQNATQDIGGGRVITTAYELEEFLKHGDQTASGKSVTSDSAMTTGAVYGCVRLITGAVATMPLDIKRKVDQRTREDASDTPLGILIRRRPNRWQKPSQFRRMLQAHVLLKGNAYCLKVISRGEVRELLPLNPDPSRMKVTQNPDLSLKYEYRRPDGSLSTFSQDEIFHLYGLTLDGITGVTPITYARETIGESLAMRDAGASVFKNGLRTSGVLEHPQSLSPEARGKLKASLDEYRSGGESEGRFLILEEGMKPSQMTMTAEDAQWIEGRKLSRTDIAMFFGVPPFMLGDTEKSTSWGSGIEQQKDGFVTFTLNDHLVMWEEGVTVDLSRDPSLYARFERNALVRGNISDRWASYVDGLMWGVYSPNEVRALEDENPRDGGDIYYPPPNTAGDSASRSRKGTGNDNPQTP